MKRARFTEEQIIGVLKEREAGAKTADLARKHGVSGATLYNWKAEYGGLDVTRKIGCQALRHSVDEMLPLRIASDIAPFPPPPRGARDTRSIAPPRSAETSSDTCSAS